MVNKLWVHASRRKDSSYIMARALQEFIQGFDSLVEVENLKDACEEPIIIII